MLNRLYIAVGSLMILMLGAAFIVPHFIDWSGRRVQMEALGSEALGTKVTIAGAIDFVLLPQPQLRFSKVKVGPAAAPVAEAGEVTADFSLMDFLRDRFVITHLAVKAPHIALSIDKNGQFVSPIHLPRTVSASNVSVADATLSKGTLTLTDARNGRTLTVSNVEGSLKLSALRGPFAISGAGDYEGTRYQGRVATSKINTDGKMQMTAFWRPQSGDFSVNLEGTAVTGDAPTFEGKVHVKVAPPQGDQNVQGVRGDLTLDSDIKASSAHVLLPNYVLLPDANRAASRLSGAAEIMLGADPSFHAVVSGGVGLPPRDARSAPETGPYELVRLLQGLGRVPVPPMSGRVGLDLAELDLRTFSLRDIRLDATTDAKGWTIETFDGLLPGDSKVEMSGALKTVKDRPDFAGELKIKTTRLDALAQMWRKPDEKAPLFNVPASLSAHVTLNGSDLVLTKGDLALDGVRNSFSARVGLKDKGFDLATHLGVLSPEQSEMLFAVLPPVGPGTGFGASFSHGTFDFGAKTLTYDGLVGKDLVARGAWGQDGLDFAQASASDFGGIGFTLKGGVSGTVAKPILTGSGRVTLADTAGQAALPVLFSRLQVPQGVRTALERALPANVQVDLKEPNDKGVQALEIDGRVGGADLALGANFGKGIVNFLAQPLGARIELSNQDPSVLMAMLGVPVDLGESGRARVVAIFDGTPLNSVDTQLTLDTDEDKLQYTGNLIVSDPDNIRGRGQIEFDVPVPEAWGEVFGAGGLYLPPIKGVGQLAFSGDGTVSASALKLDADGATVSGAITRSAKGGVPLFSGSLAIDRMDVSGLAALAGGGSALINTVSDLWPDGPFTPLQEARDTRGRIAVSAKSVVAGARILARDAKFDLTWNDKTLAVRSGAAAIGSGTADYDFSFWSAGADAARQFKGRFSVNKVAADRLMPKVPGSYISGRVTGALQASGSGGSIAAIVKTLTGSGSFTVTGLGVAGLAPQAFATVAKTKDILDLDAKALAAAAGKALMAGPFDAPSMSGVISLAGGKLRAANLSAENDAGRLFGGLAVDLNTLGLSGSWSLTPQGTVDPSGLIDENTALITADLDGTILAPARRLDLQTMADAIKVKALELEVARLEKLKAEKEARDKAAAEERARLMALDAKRQAEAAVAKAAAEKAAAEKAAAEKAAAEKAAAQKAAAEQAAAEAKANGSAASEPATGTGGVSGAGATDDGIGTGELPSLDQLIENLNKTNADLSDGTTAPSTTTPSSPTPPATSPSGPQVPIDLLYGTPEVTPN